MRTIRLRSWSGFANALKVIESEKISLKSSNGRPMELPLFRGVGSNTWGLTTTLERAFPLETEHPITDLPLYYAYASTARSAIETLLGQRFEELPSDLDVKEILKGCDSLPPGHFFRSPAFAYQYFVYLRHHGYPSPLLDWTVSPYIAAFFAFNGMEVGAKRVAVYCIVRDTISKSSEGDSHIVLLGPHVRSHRRHAIQQSRYTVCVSWDQTWTFKNHDEVLGDDGTLGLNGQAYRITIPTSERTTALKDLDLMNINEYSLFGSDDSLIRTIGRRENLLRSY